jgi:hypothetical protein
MEENKCDLMKQKSSSANNNVSAKKRGLFIYYDNCITNFENFIKKINQ